MKKVLSFILVLALTVSFALLGSCEEKTPGERKDIKIAVLKGPTALGMLKLMKDTEDGKNSNEYIIDIANEPTEIVAKVTSGEVDIAAVPTNLALQLYNKANKEVQLAALNTLGVLYLIERGDSIKSIEDLRDRTVYVSGQGATPEFIVRYILEQNGINPDHDLHIIYSTDHAAVASLCIADPDLVELAIMPEPVISNVLIKSENYRIALDITKEYEKACAISNIQDTFLAMGGIIVNREFAQNNKEALNAFLDEYKASVEYVNSNVSEAADLAVEYEIVPSKAIAQSAIPKCNIVLITGSEMRNGIEQFFKVLYDSEPSSIGGKLPEADFYYYK